LGVARNWTLTLDLKVLSEDGLFDVSETI